MELLTSAEAAEYLRLKERKLYELVATGAVPCTKVTGRWLFPKAELDRWIAASLAQPSGFMPAEPPPIIGGSHDPLLEWALRESGSALATLPEGSERGLERFLAGEVAAAAIHLHALDHGETDANIEAVRRSAKTHDAVLIAFVRREQGFVVAPGNPLGLNSIADVVERRARLALRPKGAGAQLLLLALLHRAGAPFEAIAHGPVCPTGPDIAQAIRAGHADCGIATRSVANAAGLGFVPIMWENFDLVLRQRDYFRAPMQAFLRFLRSNEFKARAQEAGGYDVSRAGQVRFAS
ncbi:MAG: helix-turn-helix transcriptional regulator [Rhodoplanes sp.]